MRGTGLIPNIASDVQDAVLSKVRLALSGGYKSLDTPTGPWDWRVMKWQVREADKTTQPAQGPGTNIAILNLKTGQAVRFVFCPQEIGVNPGSRDKNIETMGRNEDWVHSTGGSSTIRFDVDWHSDREDKRDVIEACKMLESWSKPDGYDNKKPEIRILWGTTLFSEAKFVLTEASYKLSLFDATADMMPKQAYQSLVFRKIADTNPTHSDIQRITT